MASLTSCFIYTYSYFLSSPYFEIREISVRGLKELTEKDILKLAEIKPAQNLLAVNTDVVAERISKNPWVKNMYVGREMPDRLVVEVRERHPVAMLKHGAEFYLMDTAGVVFKKYSMDDELDLPIITSAHLQDQNVSRLLSDTLLLLKTLSDSKQFAFLGAISEVQVDEYSVFLC